MRDALTIGDFSLMTHLSIKTLRYYHQVGLLEPAEVDPNTGYRHAMAHRNRLADFSDSEGTLKARRITHHLCWDSSQARGCCSCATSKPATSSRLLPLPRSPNQPKNVSAREPSLSTSALMPTTQCSGNWMEISSIPTEQLLCG
jgi:MerR family regulatory protein